MFRITRDPSSGSFIKCFAKITVTVLLRPSRQRNTHTHHGQIYCHSTDYVHVNGRDRTITVILTRHCIKLPDDGSFVIRNMLEHF